MKNISRYKAMPFGILSLCVLAIFFYLDHMLNYYYSGLFDDYGVFDRIIQIFNIKGSIGLTVVFLSLFSLSFYSYLSVLESVKEPVKVEQYILKFFNKIRFIEANKTMHYILIALRAIGFYLSFVFFVLLTAQKSTLGTGLSPMLEMVDPEFYLPNLRYFLIAYLVFELGNTLFVKTKHSVSGLFVLNLYFIPLIASIVAGFAGSNEIQIINRNIEFEIIDFAKIIAISIFFNVAYVVYDKFFNEKEIELSFFKDSFLPLFSNLLIYPLVFTFFVYDSSLLNNEKVAIVNGENIKYKENVLTMDNTTMFEEDFLELSIGYPFKLSSHMLEALALAENNNLDEAFLETTIDLFIQQNELYKKHRNRILDINVAEQYYNDYFKVKMLKIRIGVADLEKETVFLQLLKDKKYQEAWDMYQQNILEAQKRDKRYDYEINSNTIGHRIGVENSIEDIFVYLSLKGLIDLNLEKFEDDKNKKSLNSVIDSYKKILKETKGKTEYLGRFELSYYSVESIENIIKRHKQN